VTTAWTSDELERIGRAEELEVAPLRADGANRPPTPVWVVRVGDDLYVCSWRGRGGAWYRAAAARGQGRISADDVTKDVAFVPALKQVNDAVDAGYREKYARYASYVPPMLAEHARSTTPRLVPSKKQR
jgi:hypothetical protein